MDSNRIATIPAVSASHNPKHEEKLQIVLVGTTGSGKSALGNTIIGKKKFVSFASDQSVTVKCQREIQIITGIKVTIIDTPGCHCTSLSDVDIISQLKELTETLEQPYAFLLVIPAGYFTPQENETVSMLQEALGESYLSHTVIIFSKSDNLELKSKSEQDFINEGNIELQELINKCDDRYNFINNRRDRNEREIIKLLGKLMEIAKKNKRPVTPQQSVENSRYLIPSLQQPKEKKRVREESNVSETQPLANTCLMVLGMKGVGKTASIKSILPAAELTEHEGCSVYSTGQMKMVECPGFDQDPGEIRDSIQRGLHVCAPGPHVILIVMKVDRFSPATKKTMLHIQTLLEKAAQKPVIILFTRKADLEDKDIDKFILECEDLEAVVSIFGSRYFALENRDAEKQSQVRELLNMIGELLNTNKEAITGREKQPSFRSHRPAARPQGGGKEPKRTPVVETNMPISWKEGDGRCSEPHGTPVVKSNNSVKMQPTGSQGPQERDDGRCSGAQECQASSPDFPPTTPLNPQPNAGLTTQTQVKMTAAGL